MSEKIFVAPDVLEVISDPEDDDLPVGFVRPGASVALGVAWLEEREVVELARSLVKYLSRRGVELPVVAKVEDSNEGQITLAIQHSREVEFSYAKGDGAVIERRRLKPSVVQENHGHKLVVGYDPDRDEPRAYRLDRVKGAVTLL